MAFDTFAKTTPMYVPSQGKVVSVNEADVAYLRETAGALTPAEYEATTKTAAASPKPFKTKAEKEAAEKEAAEKEAAELAAKNAAQTS
jgi:hypothetical protein